MPRRLTLGALVLGVLMACAHMEAPPGGPPDAAAPLLLGTYPESLTVPADFDGWAEFRFDEVIDEGAQPNFGLGSGTLEALVILSPDTLVPRVEWRRNRIVVKPRRGWRPNTVYRIELAPGVTDISRRHNPSRVGGAITLTTGPVPPSRYLSGRVVDWPTQRPVPNALVQAIHLPDSAIYRTLADSTGRFQNFGPLPDGEYLVAGVIDQDRNRLRGRAESWDTVRAGGGANTVGEIWAFPRDTAPPRVRTAERVDSVTVALTLTQLIDPAFAAGPDAIRVLLLPDSVSIGPLRAMTQAVFDSLRRRAAPAAATARPDSIAVRDSLARDSVAQAAKAAEAAARPGARGRPAPPPDTLDQKRPTVGNRLIVQTTGRLQPGNRYFVEVRGVRGLAGAVGSAIGVVSVPKIDSAKVRADSIAKAVADSTAKARADSLKADSTRARTRPDSLRFRARR